MKPYTYRGKILDFTKAPKEPKPKKVRAPLKPGARCGTYSGYKAHRVYGEEACARCKEALASYSREYRARIREGYVPPQREFNPERCGTYAGFTRHKRYDVPPCQACMVAKADYMYQWRAKRKQAA